MRLKNTHRAKLTLIVYQLLDYCWAKKHLAWMQTNRIKHQ